MICENIGERVWVRYRASKNSTEVPRWFRYERLASGDLRPMDAFDEPHRTLIPWGTWSYEQLYGPSTLTLSIGEELDKDEALRLVDGVWINWDGAWRRMELQRAKQIAALLDEPVSVGAVDPYEGRVEGRPRASKESSSSLAIAPAPQEEQP